MAPNRPVREFGASEASPSRAICDLPADGPADARVPGQESALAKWDAHVEKWVGWASERGMTVEFAYWGSSELLERLTRPEHVGRVRFWFDETGFDDDWFVHRLEEARQTAGPRYTPEVHVDLPIAGRFEAFGRTSGFFDRTIGLIRGLANEWASACSPGPSRLGKEGDPEVEAGIRAVSDDAVFRASKVSIGEGIDEIVAAGSAIEVQPSGTLPFDGVAEKVAGVEAAVGDIAQHLTTRQGEHGVIPQYRHQFETFAGKLRKVREELVEAQRWGGAAVMIVRGQARIGKTHLLCDVAHHRIAKGRPTVLLLGQSFTSDGAPWPQAAELLDASDSSAAGAGPQTDRAIRVVAGVRAGVEYGAFREIRPDVGYRWRAPRFRQKSFQTPHRRIPTPRGPRRGSASPDMLPRPSLSPEYERAGETSRRPFPSPGGGLAVGPKWKGTTGRMKNLTPACSRASGESGCGPRPGRRWRKNQSPR